MCSLLQRKSPGSWNASYMGVGSRLCQRKSADAKVVVGELIMLDIVIHLSTDLKLVFYKTWALCLLYTERKNWNFRQTKLNLCMN